MFSQFRALSADHSDQRDLSTQMANLSLLASPRDKIRVLANRWDKERDSDAKRLVSKILKLYQHNDIVLLSLLEDNPVAFDNSQKQSRSPHPDLFWFEVACLCGSETIVDHLIKQNRVNVLDSEDGIAYALSSRNQAFALRLANFAQEHGKTNPGKIFLYGTCKFKDVLAVQAIFKSKQLPSFSIK